MTGPILELVQSGDLWIGDRNFCTTALLFGIVKRSGSFVIRQHGSTLTWELAGECESKGRSETGSVFQQDVRLSDGQGGTHVVRRITVELHTATRDGDRTLHILTNLPEEVADAIKVADLYRKRWRLETAFQEMEATLRGEIDTLGYPRAALFALCVAFVAYNVMSVMKAALRSVHGTEAIDKGVSGWYLAEEISATARGMQIAIPADEWTVFHELPVSAMGQLLQELARRVRLSEYSKQPRGPKKAKPKKASGYKKKHLSTAKLLKNQNLRK
jgi:hypothetical protein